MVYVLFVKENVAMAKSCRKSIDNIDLGVYDSCEIISEEEYNTIELPANKVDGVWVTPATIPKIDYPKTEKEEESVTELEQLRADVDYLAIMTGVEL